MGDGPEPAGVGRARRVRTRSVHRGVPEGQLGETGEGELRPGRDGGGAPAADGTNEPKDPGGAGLHVHAVR